MAGMLERYAILKTMAAVRGSTRNAAAPPVDHS
jgi:hypothetical protein